MARTQIIIGRKHGKKSFEILLGPETTFAEQSQFTRDCAIDAAQGSHPKLAEVQVWTSEAGISGGRVFKFRTPSEQDKVTESQAEQRRIHDESKSKKTKPVVETRVESKVSEETKEQVPASTDANWE